MARLAYAALGSGIQGLKYSGTPFIIHHVAVAGAVRIHLMFMLFALWKSSFLSVACCGYLL